MCELGAPRGGLRPGLGRAHHLRRPRRGADLRDQRGNRHARTWTRWSRALNERALERAAPRGARSTSASIDRHRMEILRRDVRLRDGDIELQLDGQHEIHHFQGADPQDRSAGRPAEMGSGMTRAWPQHLLSRARPAARLPPPFACGSTRGYLPKNQGSIIPCSAGYGITTAGFTYVFKMSRASLSDNIFPPESLSEVQPPRIIRRLQGHQASIRGMSIETQRIPGARVLPAYGRTI